MQIIRLNGELVPLTRLSALRIMNQKRLAELYPSCYPQFSYLRRFRNALCRLFSPRKSPRGSRGA